METKKQAFNSEGWEAEWNEKGFMKETPTCDAEEILYYCKEDDKIHTLTRVDYKEHYYQQTECVDWSEYMFEDSEVALYYCSKNNEIYESNVGDTIANQHSEQEENEEEIYDTLEEAFKDAFIKAAGVEGHDVPIFQNSNGKFEVGGYQSPNYRDISDGSFEEIGRVNGWDVDVYEYAEDDMTDDEKGEVVYQSNGSDFFKYFCEQYEIE